MAKSVIWDKQASEDMHDIYNFWLDKSENYADAVMEAIFSAADLIEKFPFLGRVVPETNLPAIREMLIQRYRVIYFVSESPEIRILAVRHGSRPLGEFDL